MKTKITRLIRSGRSDTTIIAFLMLESYFRPLKYRTLEYVYWSITGDLDTSLGLAQIKAKNNLLLNNNNIFSRIKDVKKLESFEYNYDCIDLYINKDIRYCSDDVELCKFYNGEYVTMSYINYYKFAKVQIENIKIGRASCRERV